MVRVVVGWAHILKKGKEDTLNVPLCVDQVRGWCAVVALGMGNDVLCSQRGTSAAVYH